MADIAAWAAPAATMLAAMMTAANLGARLTGAGFVVFTAGSLLWSYIGISTDQTGLLVTNAFLTLVNLVGVWRWLGRQRKYEDGAQFASDASQKRSGPTLVSGSGIGTLKVEDKDGMPVGHAVDAMLSCDDRQVQYLVIALSHGSLAERLVAVHPDDVHWLCDKFTLKCELDYLARAPELADGKWPDAAQALAWREPQATDLPY